MNPEHRSLIQKGAAAWNEWREDHRTIYPDLSGANLSNMGLSGIDLRQADLSGANLKRTWFHGADLRLADLSGANLSRAHLRGAGLSRANLSHIEAIKGDFWGADLSEANLADAVLDEASFKRTRLVRADFRRASLLRTRLEEANLSEANLSGATVCGAVLRGTILGATDLRNIDDLNDCQHDGPSVVDHHTLVMLGHLPIPFLRGCGLPEKLLDNLPTLFDVPTEYYSCFISYASEDNDFALRLHADLQNRGVRCWFAPVDMKIGDRLRTRIDEVIRGHDKLLLILSENSVASGWVEKEVETAFEHERKTGETVLFPIRLDDEVVKNGAGWTADIRRARHVGDFCDWISGESYQRSLDRLLRDLKIV